MEWFQLTAEGSSRSGRAFYKRGGAHTPPHILREQTDLWPTSQTVYLTAAELAAIPPVAALIEADRRLIHALDDFMDVLLSPKPIDPQRDDEYTALMDALHKHESALTTLQPDHAEAKE